MNNNNTVTISLIQNNVSPSKNEQLQKTITLVKDAISKGSKIICLQELYRTLYFPQYEHSQKDDYAETIPGESTHAFQKLAKKYNVVIIVPIFEKSSDGNYYNSAVVINEDGNLLETYRKIHIPQDPKFNEKNYFKAGNHYRIYKTTLATFAVLICYDQWFPEAARAVSLKGADIIFYPTAIGTMINHTCVNDTSSDGDWHDAWETVMRGHAISNAVHVAAINRIGIEDKLNFWGQSFVCDSFGTILKRASENKKEVVVCKINLEHNKQIREGWGFFRNRRQETYGTLIENKNE